MCTVKKLVLRYLWFKIYITQLELSDKNSSKIVLVKKILQHIQ